MRSSLGSTSLRFRKHAYRFFLLTVTWAALASSSSCTKNDNNNRKKEHGEFETVTLDCSHEHMEADTGKLPQEFSFLNGQWHCVDTIHCGGGTLYKDSILSLYKTFGFCFDLPYASHHFINSFGIETDSKGRIDSLTWFRDIRVDNPPEGWGHHDMRATGIACGYHIERSRLKTIGVWLPNDMYVLEYISDDTLGYFYDSYFFIMAKQ